MKPTIQLLGLPESSYSVTTSASQPGVEVHRFSLHPGRRETAAEAILDWFEPLVDIHTVWTPLGDVDKGFDYEWDRGWISRNVNGAPVVALMGADSVSRVTIALSETTLPVRMRYGVREEDGHAHIRVYPLSTVHAYPDTYDIELRIDRRPLPLVVSLGEVTQWWDSLRRHPVLPAPPEARHPFYSTWYNFHQELEEERLLKECRLAADLGMKGVIIDDGWQTEDSSRGYASCGDWHSSPSKIRDMGALVRRIHDIGMKVLLWYAVPFVGDESEARREFEPYALRHEVDHAWEQEERGWIVVDPRYPEARRRFTEKLITAMTEWKLDGFKLDFVDEFSQSADTTPYDPATMDCPTVEEGADRLLYGIRETLSGINPEVLIEFRQAYVGPDMRSYGNIFRANDCPNNALYNKIRTLDLRLLSDSTAVHSDMIMWHPEDSVGSAALQLAAVLFSVPQLSVRLEELTEEHRSMLRWWLELFGRFRRVLQFGKLVVRGVEGGYTGVTAEDATCSFNALYGDRFLELPPATSDKQIVVVNGGPKRTIAMTSDSDTTERRGILYNALGHVVDHVSLVPGTTVSLGFPTAGVLIIE